MTIISNRLSWASYCFKLMCLSLLPAFIYGYSCVPQAYRDQRVVLDPLKLKLQGILSHHVGIGIDSGSSTREMRSLYCGTISPAPKHFILCWEHAFPVHSILHMGNKIQSCVCEFGPSDHKSTWLDGIWGILDRLDTFCLPEPCE